MDAHVYVTDIESVTARKVSGDGEQIDLLLRSRKFTLVLRLISRRGKKIRILDLRQRDGKKTRPGKLIEVPMMDVFPNK